MHVQECDVCQRNKGDLTHPTSVIQPLVIPERKWESISMDFITELPAVKKFDFIYVGFDRFNNFSNFFIIPSKSSSMQVVDILFREVFKLHGLPKTIITNQDNRFMVEFSQELFRLMGTVLTLSTRYHPQIDGKTNIMNKWLERYLHNYMIRNQHAWVKHLHLGEYYYNTTHHMYIGMPPFCALYGCIHYLLWT